MLRDSVQWGEIEIAYRYRFFQGRTLNITVHPDLGVEVAAPKGTPLDGIRAKVRKRGAWIANARRGFASFHPLQPPRRYVPGETHRYLGRQYRLRVVDEPEESVKLQGGYLQITTPRRPTPGVLRPLVLRWYEQRAGEILRERTAACQVQAASHGFPRPRLAIRVMTTRWGSCSRRGQVTLNPELIKAPRDCIDYVISHELCHLVEHSHGPRFWKLLEQLMPNWEERRMRLNRLGNL